MRKEISLKEGEKYVITEDDLNCTLNISLTVINKASKMSQSKFYIKTTTLTTMELDLFQRLGITVQTSQRPLVLLDNQIVATGLPTNLSHETLYSMVEKMNKQGHTETSLRKEKLVNNLIRICDSIIDSDVILKMDSNTLREFICVTYDLKGLK